jgi:arabinose-5-phosphate isomerase
MRSGAELPVVDSNATLADALIEMSGKGMGMTAVVDADGRIAGIFTDGDLRRSLARVDGSTDVPIAQIMTQKPRTIAASRLAIDCVDLMEAPPPKVQVLLVADEAGRLVGALHMHDLFRARVV